MLGHFEDRGPEVKVCHVAFTFVNNLKFLFTAHKKYFKNLHKIII